MQSLFKNDISYKPNIHCYWCRHKFITQPIGCPIQYIPSILSKRYYSELTKEFYTINETVSKDYKHTDDYKNEYTFKKNDYYKTDGLFCSFNCCLSFIEDNNHNPLYSLSKTLLYTIYHRLHPTIKQINKAPDWRLLDCYGGHLTIEEFRHNFNKIQYTKKNQYINMMKSIGWLYEKIMHF